MLDTSATSRMTAAAAPSAVGEAAIRADAMTTEAAIIDIVKPFERAQLSAIMQRCRARPWARAEGPRLMGPATCLRGTRQAAAASTSGDDPRPAPALQARYPRPAPRPLRPPRLVRRGQAS